MKFEVREIKKTSIDTYDIYTSIKYRIEVLDIKDETCLNSNIKYAIDEYLELYGIDKNNVPEEDYKTLFDCIKKEFQFEDYPIL